MAIFTLLHIDRGSLGDGTMLLSEARKRTNSLNYMQTCSYMLLVTFSTNVNGEIEILVTSETNIKANVREQGERERTGERGVTGRKSNSHLEGFQQAQTVTRVIRRNMPPVDRMMYSELRPKPE